MRLKYFFLIVTLIVLFGLNIASQGITSVVGDGPWDITSFQLNESYIILGLFGREITLPIPEAGKVIWEIVKKVYYFAR